MAADAPYANNDLEVQDAENYVDKRQKQRILELRDEVDEWKKEFLTSLRLDDINEQAALLIWGDRVRDYLLAVEPILRAGDETTKQFALAGAERVYSDAPLGEIRIDPPEEYQDRQQGGRRSRPDDGPEISGGDAIEPKVFTIRGIKSVIEREELAAKWEIQVRHRNAGSGPRRETRTITKSRPLNRITLQNAVRVTDEWLQEAGVGVTVDSGLETEHL